MLLMFVAQSKSAASSTRDWTEQETLLLLEVQIADDDASPSVLMWCLTCLDLRSGLGNVQGRLEQGVRARWQPHAGRMHPALPAAAH